MVGGTEGGGFRSGDLGGGRVGYGGVRCLQSRLVPAGVVGRQKDTLCALTGVTYCRGSSEEEKDRGDHNG